MVKKPRQIIKIKDKRRIKFIGHIIWRNKLQYNRERKMANGRERPKNVDPRNIKEKLSLPSYETMERLRGKNKRNCYSAKAKRLAQKKKFTYK